MKRFFCLLLPLGVPFCAAQTITVDGVRNEAGYTSLAFQSTTTGWGDGNVLANLQAAQTGALLHVHVAGRASGNAIILFLDTKPGGNEFIGNNVITSGGEANTINNFGTAAGAGMRFEPGFAPDYAVRIYGAGTDAYVNTYNLATGVRAFAGNAGSANISSGIISSLRAAWADIAAADYAFANTGVEMNLNMTSMGVPNGTQTVKLMALLVNGESNYGSNQVLGSRSGGDMAGGMNTLNWGTEAGDQTLSFTVINEDTDGDGTPDSVDTDDDNDGLLDTVETNTGTYVSATNTGTDPLAEDSDDDTYKDAAELASVLGYFSDPNVPNYLSMAVPGDYTTPIWKEDGSAGNAMQQVGTSLSSQFGWKLNYRFSQANPTLRYKYAANGNWTKSWGVGAAAGTVALGGGNIITTVTTTGFHVFTLDTKLQTQSLTRQTFASEAAYLTAYGLTDAAADEDGDSLSNGAEFVLNTDPTVGDTDGDTVEDNLDTNPLVPLTQYEQWAGVNQLSGPAMDRTADPDADGMNNVTEYLLGTDPKSGKGSPLTASASGAGASLSWLARTAGVSYQLEESLLQPGVPWAASSLVPGVALDQAGVPAGYMRMSVEVTPAAAKAFFRLKATETP